MAAKKKKARAKTGSKAKKGRKPAKRKAARKPAKRKVAAKRKAAPKRKVAAKKKAAPKKKKAAPKLAAALAPSVERLKYGATEMGQSAMDAGRVLVDEAKEVGREAQDKIKDITTDWFNRG